MLQGFWYRFLVDAKIWEIKRELSDVETRHATSVHAGNATSEERIVAWLREKYGV